MNSSPSRFGEFFEDDSTLRRSMNRLAAFVAISGLTSALFFLLVVASTKAGTDLREYLSAITTVCIIIAGLGGFNYALGRAAGAYTEVRVAQAAQGIQPAALERQAAGPTTQINVGSAAPPPAEMQKSERE